MKEFSGALIIYNLATFLLVLIILLCVYIIEGKIDLEESKMFFRMSHTVVTGAICIIGGIILIVNQDY